MDQANDLKIDALMTIAKAFYDRGSGIQYDELSMDRICRITPRRELFSPPEKATKQHTLFLDCSSFVFSTFYQAFGYIFEADVTNDMIDLSDIRVFYYEIRGNETEDEKISVMKKFKETLQAGDVTVSVYNNGNGHAMLYAGNVPKVVFYNKDYSSDLSSLTPEEIIDGLFEKQAKSEGEVYHLRAGSNLEPILVPGLFGGYGVITPEIVKSPEMRTHRITLSSLQEGNLIIYKDSPYEPAKAVKYYGNERFDFSEGKEASDFVDTLFGCFCFCVIRY